MKKGFSLIELVIVVGLTSLLTIAITSVSITSIVGANRVRNLIKTRQAGDGALNQIQTSLRNARDISVCNSANNQLTMQNMDGGTTTLSLELTGELGRIASNSGSYLTPADITVTNFDLQCSPTDTEISLITVKFEVKSSIAGSRSQDTPTIPYETTVQLRNF
jgi:type II secretory pathway pseudopilin PulG